MNIKKKDLTIKLPPNGFFIIEETIFRCTLPLTRENLIFLKQFQIKIFLNLTNHTFSDDFLSVLNNNSVLLVELNQFDINLHHIFSNHLSCIKSIKSILEFIFGLSSSSVLILGDLEYFLDSLVVSCLRRIQNWALSSIIAEFRFISGRKNFDLEQLIESFPTNIFFFPSSIPKYIYQYLTEENSSIENAYLDSISSIDHNSLISSNVQYDPNLRYFF